MAQKPSDIPDIKYIYKQVFFDFSALGTGLLLPFAFAPYKLFWLAVPLLVWLFLICMEHTPRRALRRGWLFGFGWFVHGVHWVYYSLHDHGGSPAFLAFIIIALLAAYLALFPALAMYASQRFFRNVSPPLKFALAMPALWLVSEWLRGYLLTGFPWLQLGYSQVDGWLAGYAPIVGGLGVSGLLVLVAGLLVALLLDIENKKLIASVLLVWLGGFLLLQVNWTVPTGDSLRVSMIQGNIPQSEKWKPERHDPTLAMYRRLTMLERDRDLIIWPETAVPDFYHRVPYFLDGLKKEMQSRNKDLLLGIFVSDEQRPRYFNSVVSIRGGVYKKRHLVPLGEYFPLRGLLDFFRRWINIPMSDVDAGPRQQPLLTVAGQPLAVNICFEDAFDRAVLLDLPEARMLVNFSNDAWFEDSPQAWQHHQIARMRALETGRYMLRSTNTGISAVIDAKGRVEAVSPQFEPHVLRARVPAYTGMTPYVWWRNYFSLGLAVVVLILIAIKSRHAATER